MQIIHEADIYDKRQAKEFIATINSQINQLIESMTALILKIKRAEPTTDQAAIINGTGVDKRQKEIDLRTAIEVALSLRTMHLNLKSDEADAETAALTNTKYKFKLTQAPGLAVDLMNAYNKIMSISPRKKAYQATEIWDPKKYLNVDRRLFNLSTLFKSHADGDDRKMLEEIKKIRSEIHYRLVSLADHFDKIGLTKMADTLDSIRIKIIAKAIKNLS